MSDNQHHADLRQESHDAQVRLTARQFGERYNYKQPDPLWPSQSVDPWPEIRARLDGEPDEVSDQREKLGRALKEIIRYLLQDDWQRPEGVEMIGKRTLAFAWVFDPALVGGASMSELSRRQGLPNVEQLSRHTATVRRVFGLHNRFQSHGARFKEKEVQHAAT